MARTPLSRAALTLLAGAFIAAALPASAQDAQRVLALVTTAEPQVQGMAFVLLNAMRQQGATVEVMLCGPAADLARRESPAAVPLRPMNATPAAMLAGMVRAGVRTEVCALYLPNAGVGPEALIEGVRPAQPPEMARRITDRATTVLPF
ncbi:DsrE family protein [Elioraea sp.]|uniref:DsrE family protein n=1 Tax=Elioraea sp. TaxID=2185103 RepID=UPI0025B8B017|nr:DsrE family protein [Elioraea sp.]